MTQEPTQATPTAEAIPAERGSLDAAELAFEQVLTPAEEAEEQQPEAEEEATSDDPNAEADEGESDEDTDAPALETVEIDGETFEVHPKVAKGYMRQADYSRKMNDLSAQRATVEHQAKAIEAAANATEEAAKVAARVQVLESTIEQFKAINWQELEATDPGKAALIGMRAMNTMQELERAKAAAPEIKAKALQALEESRQAKRGEMLAALPKLIKGFSNAKGEELTAYAEKTGLKDDLFQVTNPQWVVALDKAAKYDALMAGKTALKAKASAAPPVLKPGAPKRTDPQTDAMAALRKHKTQDAAEAAFLSRFK